MNRTNLIFGFFLCTFSPARLIKISQQKIKTRTLYFVYFVTTFFLALLLRFISLSVVGRDISTFHSYLHYGLFLMRNAVVLGLVDFGFLVGLRFIIADKREGEVDGSFALKLVVFTNFPIILGSLLMSIVSFLPIYFSMVVWKFMSIRIQLMRKDNQKRQINLNIILLFGYYALLYYIASWAVSGFLVWLPRLL